MYFNCKISKGRRILYTILLKDFLEVLTYKVTKTAINVVEFKIYLTFRLKHSLRQQILESGRVFLGVTMTLEARGVLA